MLRSESFSLLLCQILSGWMIWMISPMNALMKYWDCEPLLYGCLGPKICVYEDPFCISPLRIRHLFDHLRLRGWCLRGCLFLDWWIVPIHRLDGDRLSHFHLILSICHLFAQCIQQDLSWILGSSTSQRLVSGEAQSHCAHLMVYSKIVHILVCPDSELRAHL